MDNIFKATIIGRPIAKSRPRFARIGKFVKTYNDQKTEEGLFLFHLQQQMNPGKDFPFKKAINMWVTFHMPVPKSTSKKRRAAMIKGEIAHIKRPDLDNMIKFVKDCYSLAGVWKDDSQVIYVQAEKVYGELPRTEIKIEEFIGVI